MARHSGKQIPQIQKEVKASFFCSSCGDEVRLTLEFSVPLPPRRGELKKLAPATYNKERPSIHGASTR